MKSIEELKKMSLEDVRTYKNSLNERNYLEKVEAILSIREAESVDLYEPMQEIEIIELRGGKRDGSGRKATGVKRSKPFPAKLSEDEVFEVNRILNIVKEKEEIKSNTDAILKILELYEENK